MAEKTFCPLELFYSYSHKDEEFRDTLETHLILLKRQSFITGWHDRKISGGKEWKDAIDEHLESADIILLLISVDFLASDYCYDVEMKRAMERHDAGTARVVPIILRTCYWKSSPFGKLQALPKDGKPIKSWTDRDDAFTDVAAGIRKAVQEINDNTLRQWKASGEAKADVLIEKPTAPDIGDRVVQSWIFDVINPLLRNLERERERLEQKKLTWEVPPGHFKSIRPIQEYIRPFTDTLSQLLQHYPFLAVIVVIRKEQMRHLLAACIHLQDSIEKEEQLRKIYLQAKADDSMTRQGEPLNKVFNIDSEQEHLAGITQCIVNQSDEMPTHFGYYAVWNKYRDDLLALLNLPLIRMQNETVRSSAESFLITTQDLIQLLRETRSQLSLKYNVPLKS